MPAAEPIQPTIRSWSSLLAGALLAAAVGWVLWWAADNWSAPTLAGHEFRQTQTALTIDYLQETGFRLDYETPVLGKPWSIPMEFPLYQWMVASLCNLTGTDIAPTGRLVSLVFWTVGLVAAMLLLRECGLSWSAGAVAMVPIVMLPVFRFYGRSVMIESTAWALSAWFLWSVLRFRHHGRWWALGLALVTGALAAVVKGTTWAAFCLPWAFLWIADAWRAVRQRDVALGKSLAWQAGALGLPLLALGFGWVQFADTVKATNPMAHFLLSAELREFNFGTWEQRTDAASWRTMEGHVSSMLMPGLVVAGLSVAGLVWSRVRAATAIALGAFGLTVFIFTNLYLLHDYYLFACGAFLIVPAVMVVGALWDKGKAWRGLAALGVLGLAVAQHEAFVGNLYATQVDWREANTQEVLSIKTVTDPADVVIMHSPSWSSHTAYYSGRRMLRIPNAEMFLHPGRVKQNLAALADESVGLVLVQGDAHQHPDWIADRIEEFDLWPTPAFKVGHDLTGYVPVERAHRAYEDLVRADIHDLEITNWPPLAPIGQRRAPLDLERGEAVHLINPYVTEVVLPFGVQYDGGSDDPFILAHAPSEFFLQPPADARTVELRYRLNPDIFGQPDFDGIAVFLETIASDGSPRPFWLQWESPRGDPTMRTFSIPLPADAGEQILFRVLAGPANNNAFDHLFLHELRFR